ncbi:MAG: TonB-dependent receptor [Lentisphaerae bacterium]|nr:TonB-dependent receptor [Lentisphaerota bacterium]
MDRKAWGVLGVAGAAVLAAAPVLCEETAVMDDMVVSATLTEMPASHVGSSVTVITADEILRSRKTSLADVLRAVAGIHVVQNGGAGGAAGVFIRGANTEHTLVLVDGVELNDPINPSRGADISNIGVADIERIEILRGPQSGLYGSDAIGGVINIITRRGSDGAKAVLTAEAGSFGTYRGAATLGGGGKRGGYSISVGRFGTRGVSAAGEDYAGNTEKDGFVNTEISGRADWKALDNLALHVLGRYTDSDSDTDAFEGDYGDDPDGYSRRRQGAIQGGAELELLEGRWKQVLTLSHIGTERENDGMFGRLNFDSVLLKAQWRNEFALPGGHVLVTGAEYETEEGKSDGLPRTTADSFGFLAQDSVTVLEKLHLTAGGRWDTHEDSGDALTYRFSPAWQVAGGTTLKASVGTGYKAPSLYQLHAPATPWGAVGNEDLDPEKSIGWDAGIEQEWFSGRCGASATYFENRVNDLIEYNFGYVNRPESEMRGVETALFFKPVATVSVRAGYTRLDAEDADTGERLVRRPEHRATLDAGWQFVPGARVDVGLVHVGERDDNMWDPVTFMPVRVELDPYTLVNVAVSCRVNDNAEVFARVENLLDEEYEDIWGTGTTGLGAYGGVRVTL